MGCLQRSEPTCFKCISAALRIKTLGLNGEPLLPDSVAVAFSGRTAWVRKSDSRSGDSATFPIIGGPGRYALKISYPGGETASVTDVDVKQNPAVTCDHALTENLTLQKKLVINKSTATEFTLIKQTSEGACL